MKVYLDNNVVSGIARRDLPQPERDAIEKTCSELQAQRIEVGASRHSTRELERAPREFHDQLKRGLTG